LIEELRQPRTGTIEAVVKGAVSSAAKIMERKGKQQTGTGPSATVAGASKAW
jgi:hypothetical protein